MDLNLARRIVQWLALIGSNLYLGFTKTKQVYQGSLKSVCVPFLNCHSCPGAFCSCPLGTGQHFMTLHRIPFILLAYFIAVGVLVGSMACGWLCPFGLLQDLMYKIKSIKIRISHQLSSLRYLFLLFLVILLPLVTQQTWFSKFCPMGTLQAALPWAIWNPTIPVYNEPVVSAGSLGIVFVAKTAVMVFFMVMFVISKRPFCRIVCPLGAIFGLFNRISLIRLQVDEANCKRCQKCAVNCPVDLNVCESTNSGTCVRCFRCLKCENVRLEIFGAQYGNGKQESVPEEEAAAVEEPRTPEKVTSTHEP